MTEGAAALVLEDWDRAVARGATIYAELAGAASTADAHHITAPAPDGSGAVACMELALVDAGIGPSDVGHINAHGTSTPLNDLAEARAITKVFGEPGPLVTSTKGVTGHGLAAAGAIEAVAAVLTIDRATIPPTAGYERARPRDHDPDRARRAAPVGAGRGALQLLRLRRPQRLPGAAAPWLSPAGKVAPPLPPGQRLVRSVDGKAANLGRRGAPLPPRPGGGGRRGGRPGGGRHRAGDPQRSADAVPDAPPRRRPGPSPSGTRSPTGTGWPTPT